MKKLVLVALLTLVILAVSSTVAFAVEASVEKPYWPTKTLNSNEFVGAAITLRDGETVLLTVTGINLIWGTNGTSVTPPDVTFEVPLF